MGETGGPANPAQPILADTINVTKVGGLAAVVTTVGAALFALLNQFNSERTAVGIAVIAAAAVAMVVVGYIAVNDMRVRNRQTIVDNYLKYLSSRPELRGQNGHAHLMAPASSTFVKLIGKEDDPIWQLLAVKVDMEADRERTSYLAGNGVEKPSWFKEDEIRILAPS